MLIQACLSGDRSAFGKLVDKYESAMFNAAYRITGSVDDAMDATQTAFVNAYEKLDTFDPSYRFFSWIYRITLNQAFNLVDRRRPTKPIAHDRPSEHKNPEATFAETETTRFMQQALMHLDLRHRTVVVLKHIEGFSYREISVLLGIPEKTVKSRLFTARRKLREILLEKGYAP